MGYAMNRRQIVSLVGVAAIVGPTAALAQISADRRRRVGLMVATGENDAEGTLRAEAFSRAAMKLPVKTKVVARLGDTSHLGGE